MLSLLLFLLFLGVAYPDGIDYTTEDVDFPEECKSIAKPGDHIMIEYSLTSGSLEHAAQMQPENFHHVVLQDEDTLLHRTLKGMCENSTRLVRFTGGGDKVLVLPPILPSFRVSKEAGNTDLKVIVRHITQAEDYDIFHAMRVNNFSRVIDLIDEQRGVNAIDEYGQSILMTAVQRGVLPVVASLLNARRPRVEIDLSKGNGFTALFYAVDLPQVSILQALLRRGANPNKVLKSDGNKGNTPLHVATRFEKREHAKMLLDYGALPHVANAYGQTPLQLLPRGAVVSTKKAFKKNFDEAAARLAQAAKDGLELPSGNKVPIGKGGNGEL